MTDGASARVLTTSALSVAPGLAAALLWVGFFADPAAPAAIVCVALLFYFMVVIVAVSVLEAAGNILRATRSTGWFVASLIGGFAFGAVTALNDTSIVGAMVRCAWCSATALIWWRMLPTNRSISETI